MQYVRWIREQVSGHEIETIQVASRIAALERDEVAFEALVDKVRRADAVLWAFPLYYSRSARNTSASSSSCGSEGRPKPSEANTPRRCRPRSISSITRRMDTSAGWPEDLGMAFTGSFSPQMDDLKKIECRKQLLRFVGELIDAAERKLPLQRRTAVFPQRGAGSSPAPRASGTYRRRSPAPAAGSAPYVLSGSPELAISAMARVTRPSCASRGRERPASLHRGDGHKGRDAWAAPCAAIRPVAYEGKDGFIESFISKVMGRTSSSSRGTIMDGAFSARWKASSASILQHGSAGRLWASNFLFCGGHLSLLGNLPRASRPMSNGRAGNLVHFVSG